MRRRSDLLLGGIALASVLLHLPFLRSYGWFRDEFYYVVCGRHLDFGYVDHPPFVALVARLVTAACGDSLAALRLVAALTGAAVVYLAGRIARELGGGLLAQGLAALCALIAPVYLSLFHIFTMNCFDVLFWTLGALVVVRILETGNPRLWLLFGLIAGIGLQNKHSLLFFGLGVLAGVLLTPERRTLRSPWIWLGGAVAVLLFLPNVLWEVAHGWPTLEFVRNAEAHKNVALSPVEFLAQQVLLMHPLTLPVWLAGLGWYLFSRPGRPFRLLGWIYLTALAVLLTQNSKPYYLAPSYPFLFAAGGTAIEGWLARLRQPRLRPALAGAMLLLLIVGGAVIAPLVVPILPVDRFIRYQRALGIQASAGERHRMGDLPQHFADMHGWPEMVAEVARVYRTLTPGERARAMIFGQNYGEAGAVDVLGPSYGLPGAVSGHNSYFLWGPPERSDVGVIIGGDEDDNRAACVDLQRAGEIRCGHCMPYEDRNPVYICRGLKIPWRKLWPRVKSFG
ncbi:MAG TPA: glycosyltransferase family 39 protein [Thermoanaerobaculia bacterium]|jgi:4-amino-4-deoxy-L-arabinose transferase-like glycosyltransferase